MEFIAIRGFVNKIDFNLGFKLIGKIEAKDISEAYTKLSKVTPILEENETCNDYVISITDILNLAPIK